MNRFQLLQILSKPWAIEPKFLDLHFEPVSTFLKGNVEFEKIEEPQANKPFALFGSDNKNSRYDDAPAGSIAIIPITGVMTKQDQFCGPAGTATIANRIKTAESHKNIDAIILQFDTGGGAVSAINPLADAIENCQKPVIAFVDDLMASAGLMSGAYADLIIASHDMASVGSLGVMASFIDFQPYWEKEGIVFHKIYADQSKDKNKPFDEALKKEYKLFKEKELNPLAQTAIDNMKKLRGSKITDKSVYSADMFYAKDAVKVGLVDEIGNLDYAVKRATELANTKNKKTKRNIKNSNHTTMNKKQIPALMFVLGLETLEAVDEKFNLSADQIKSLQESFSERFGKQLSFKGVSFNDDGSGDFTQQALIDLNAVFTEEMIAKNNADSDAESELIAQLKSDSDKKIAEMQKTIDKLSNHAEEIKLKNTTGMKQTTDFHKNATGINAISAERPWNAAALAIALGHKQEANFLMSQEWTNDLTDTFIEDLKSANTGIDITNLNTELGAYFREVAPEITDMMVKGEDVSKIFPWASSGTQDIYTHISSYISEHLQARNPGEWADKGSNEFHAESVRLEAWEVTRTFKREQMQQFMKSWLATKTTGTDPYQESFVMWFINNIKKQIASVERPKNAILGVYVEAEADVPGKSIHSMNGALKTLQNLISEGRILVTRVGKGDYALLDENGNINKNHVFYKTEAIIKAIPKNLRDAFNWRVLMSKEDYRERNIFIKKVLANDPNYKEQEAANLYSNFTHTPVPYWPDGLYVVTLPANGTQLYREKSDDNRITVERLKRNTYVHMDGAYAFIYHLTGKKFPTREELIASKGEFQRIFTNGEFGPYTSIPAIADDVTPSVAVHNVLETVDNTQATAITAFDDAVVGQTIYLIGGSDVNPSSIADNAANFVGIPAGGISFTKGLIAKFQVTAVNKFTLVALYQEGSVGAIEFAADDATPDVSGGQLFITNSENTDGSQYITDFEGAAVGVPFKVLGGGGQFPSIIQKAGKFAFISAEWTAASGAEIMLQKRPDGNFVEVIE